jgi:hypothetical protein
MNFWSIVLGIIEVVSLIFVLSPDALAEVRKMDSLRLIVFSVFIFCSIYWIYFAIQHSNILKRLVNKKRNIRIIRDPRDPYQFTYLVEGNKCYHIPDPETFNYLGSYLGFSWNDLEDISADDLKREFTIGRQLPSIRAQLPKIQLIEKKID